MMTCKEAVRIMSEGMDRELDPGERLALRFHKIFCAGCRNYAKQIAFLRESCRGYLERGGLPDDAGDGKHKGTSA
ncbi:MAG: zf-HC2 domain-containing protein [Betaproteobacteria bacterium]|nr:zf-HC2 domain-containing protein [Betaproteobacteria bacterium]